MKRLLVSIFLLLFFSANLSFALNLDMSVDSEIKKKYNSNKLNEEVLPTLPAHLKNEQSKLTTSSNAKVQNSSSTVKSVIPNTQLSGIKIPSGTKFLVKSTTKLSDWNKINTQVSFVSISSVSKGSVVIPSGTVFKGYITAVRQPQISGNGGLLELDINSMIYNGNSIPIEGKILKVNSKNIFFNRIKGQRQYITGVKNKINSANNFYKKARNISNKLSANPIGAIISPIPTITGWAGAFTGTVVSPVTGLLQKGKDVSILSGTEFEIKLTKDAFLN